MTNLKLKRTFMVKVLNQTGSHRILRNTNSNFNRDVINVDEMTKQKKDSF